MATRRLRLGLSAPGVARLFGPALLQAALLAFAPPLAGGTIYFVDDPDIYRVDLDGRNLQEVVPGSLECTRPGIAYDVGPGMLYWTDRCLPDGSSTLWRMQPAGSIVGFLKLVRSDSVFVGVAIDAGHGKLYWALRTTSASVPPPGAGLIQRANLDGSGVETVISSAGDRLGGLRLDPVAGKIYWTTFRDDATASGKVRRADLDGRNLEDLITALDKPRNVALDISGGKIYWTDQGTDKIQRADLTTGGDIEDLVSGAGLVHGIDLDPAAGKMYWTAVAVGKIQRANLDGTNVEDVVTGLYSPLGIDVITQMPTDARPLPAHREFTVSAQSGRTGATFILDLPMEGRVIADLYTVVGRRVASLTDRYLTAGTHRLFWPRTGADGRPVTSGVYIYKATFGEEVRAGKILILR